MGGSAASCSHGLSLCEMRTNVLSRVMGVAWVGGRVSLMQRLSSSSRRQGGVGANERAKHAQHAFASCSSRCTHSAADAGNDAELPLSL